MLYYSRTLYMLRITTATTDVYCCSTVTLLDATVYAARAQTYADRSRLSVRVSYDEIEKPERR